jgi:coenzyme F420-reducing hydrogenase alpha subunit
MSAVAAIEAAAGVEVPHGVRALRRLLYCGEWIESHALHVYMLHAPDFLGFESAVEMAREHRARVEAGLALKKAGNEVVRVIGGREIHPVNVRAGGFYRTPSRRELQALVPGLERARDLARETVRWVAGFEFPAIERDWTFVALRNPREYPMSVGRIAASDGLDIPPAEFFEHFEEEHLPHSNALHSRRKGGGPYQTGPLARYALNRERLSPGALEAAKEVGLEPVVRNPYRSIIVRALETLHAVEEALRTIAGFEPPDPPAVPIPARAGTGIGATEAPRGLLVHRYAIDWRGVLTDARIVPPTSQNQASIEADLRAIAERFLDLDDEALRHRCEQAIRSYDPCISCATHFLKLRVERR